MHPTEHVVERSDWRSRLVRTPLGWAITLALAALGAYLFATHSGHVLSALPYLLLLLCPLMHMFGHGGHGHGHHQRDGNTRQQ
jgi:hypothetical protein